MLLRMCYLRVRWSAGPACTGTLGLNQIIAYRSAESM
jgi:hypothetical protein